MSLAEDNSGFIGKLFLRHVWSNVTAQVISTVGPIVCGMVAGTVFGRTGLAMNGLFSPFFFLAGFFGTVVASGSTALAARFVAQDDEKRVAGIYTLSLVLAAGLAAALCLVMTILRGSILAVIAGGELLEPAREYYAPTVWYMFFTSVVYVPLSWARLVGKPAIALVLTLTMAISNIAFALLFTVALGRGLQYLAVSQALSTALALLVSMILLHLPRNGLRFQRPEHIGEDTRALTVAGSPLGLSRLYRFASVFLLNIILLRAAGAEAVAVYGVLNTLLRFVTAFANGVSATSILIAGVLREERDVTSLKQLAKSTFAYGNAGILAVSALLILLREPLAGVFNMGGGMFFMSLWCFGLYIIFYMNGSMLVSWYTGVRQIVPANLVTLLQDMVLPPLFALILAGSGNIWLHLPIAGAATALLLPVIIARHKARGLSFPLLLDVRSKGPSLAFSVERDAAKASEAAGAVDTFCREQWFPKRQAMLLSMAIEEMVTLMANNDAAGGMISIRLTRFDGGTVLRLRDSGKKFNPIDYYNKRMGEAVDFEDGVDLMGVKYIVGAAHVVYYRETFGVNSLVIIL